MPSKLQGLYGENLPATETQGSSAVTARNVAIGAIAGVAVVAAAPVLLPVIGLAAVSTAVVAVGAPILAGVGAWVGWQVGGKE